MASRHGEGKRLAVGAPGREGHGLPPAIPAVLPLAPLGPGVTPLPFFQPWRLEGGRVGDREGVWLGGGVVWATVPWGIWTPGLGQITPRLARLTQTPDGPHLPDVVSSGPERLSWAHTL